MNISSVEMRRFKDTLLGNYNEDKNDPYPFWGFKHLLKVDNSRVMQVLK